MEFTNLKHIENKAGKVQFICRQMEVPIFLSKKDKSIKLHLNEKLKVK